jgi:hypothetical protein
MIKNQVLYILSITTVRNFIVYFVTIFLNAALKVIKFTFSDAIKFSGMRRVCDVGVQCCGSTAGKRVFSTAESLPP